MLSFYGKSALSPLKNAQLLKHVQQVNSQVHRIHVNYFYWLKGEAPLAANTIVADLIKGEGYEAEAGQACAINTANNEQAFIFYVTPRLGTISPWSSKAGDILSQLGLKNSQIERGRNITLYAPMMDDSKLDQIKHLLHDRMTEALLTDFAVLEKEPLLRPKPLRFIPLLEQGRSLLSEINLEMGLALSVVEMDYLFDAYQRLKRNPTDVELMMFAQANSEHCRHKIFNADWLIDGQAAPRSLFKMIKNTHEKHAEGVLSAYSDNAAVIEGFEGGRFYADPKTKSYTYHQQPIHTLIKVETHNHPTAIAPFSGAATGVGGEIRDEGATGRGAKPKAGLVGFTVSHLRMEGFEQPWEQGGIGKPNRIVSPLEIMTHAPLGGAAFGNEFGRPNLCGYFRTFEAITADKNQRWGYHKPIMLAGGLGNIAENQVEKITPLKADLCLIVLGGPAMLIGLGGGSASSQTSGESEAQLDFASVQRDNPEMERRCQEVIDQCWQLGNENPILFIHDVGAGGLSNALPELVKDGGCGGHFELRSILTAEASLSPLEIWCNEAQERYVMAVSPEALPLFQAICLREGCPFAVVGKSTEKKALVLHDEHFNNHSVDLPSEILFGHPPKMEKQFITQTVPIETLTFDVSLSEAIDRVLRFPAVASKKFLITIADRTVGGLTVRDQMVGPWQVPVADCAVTSTSFDTFTGEAMSIGERTPLAVTVAKASARMAVAEAIMNIASARIGAISDIKLSANWMAAVGSEGQDQALFEAVEAVGMVLCPELGITIPVGKDSLSMRTAWKDHAEKEIDARQEKAVISPLSLIISAFAPVLDVRKSLTPLLAREADTLLLLVDISEGAQRLGYSALAQVYSKTTGDVPDLARAQPLKSFFQAIQRLNDEGKILSYHDRSDGGLLITLLEMAFASRSGLVIHLDTLMKNNNKANTAIQTQEVLSVLFNEELGAVIQVRRSDLAFVENIFKAEGFSYPLLEVAKPEFTCGEGKTNEDEKVITICLNDQALFKAPRRVLEKTWAETSFRIQALRDNPLTAEAEWNSIDDEHDVGLHVLLKDSLGVPRQSSPTIQVRHRPRIAILRDQGVNGQVEMAMSFDRAGFEAVDVHMSDLRDRRVLLSSFQGFVACGGFSYGDVMGAGSGWAKSILLNDTLKAEFAQFFADPLRFALGVCNGCQMLSQLAEIIPGAEHWPRFKRNTSEQFEARLSMVEVQPTSSIFLSDMTGYRLPIVVAHGEGRADFQNESKIVQAQSLVTLRFIENNGLSTQRYPFNPNGSIEGITGLCNEDGRINIMMPHPERVVRTSQFSWYPTTSHAQEKSPWLEMFESARRWLAKTS